VLSPAQQRAVDHFAKSLSALGDDSLIDAYHQAWEEPTLSKGRCSTRSAAAPGKLTRTVLPQANAYAMIRRRATSTGIATKLGNRNFRATGISA
jgi:hypothetical protein